MSLFDYCDVLDPEGEAIAVSAGIEVRVCGRELPCPKHDDEETSRNQ